MKSTNYMVDRAVRQAVRDTSSTLPDLMLEGIPFTPALWMIVIEPIRPRTVSEGGIEISEISQDAEQFQITIGRVLKAGPAAMLGKTTGGVELSNFTADIRSPEQLLGQFVVHKQHVGMTLTLRKTGQTVKAMEITDLLGVTEDPHAWKFYL